MTAETAKWFNARTPKRSSPVLARWAATGNLAAPSSEGPDAKDKKAPRPARRKETARRPLDA